MSLVSLGHSDVSVGEVIHNYHELLGLFVVDFVFVVIAGSDEVDRCDVELVVVVWEGHPEYPIILVFVVQH